MIKKLLKKFLSLIIDSKNRFFLYIYLLIKRKTSYGGIHFSVDDVNGIFEDLTKNKDKYKNAFEQPYLKFIKKLHDKYGAVFSLYLFYSWDIDNKSCFKISDTTNKFVKDFKENAYWLKFGFHAVDSKWYLKKQEENAILYYNKTIKEIKRITGTDQSIDNFVRLDRFVATEKYIESLSSIKNGICGLLCPTNSDRTCYCLTEHEKRCLYSDKYYMKGNILYLPTNVWVEKITDDTTFYKIFKELFLLNNVIISTHEWFLNDYNVKKFLNKFCKYAKKIGLINKFPKDFIIETIK